MHILNGNVIPTNSIVVFCSDNNLLVAYHTGIVKSFRGKNIIMVKDSNGKYTLPDEARIPSIYYTDVFNYGKFFENFGIFRPKKFYIYFKEKSDGLSELFKEYEINKKEAKKQSQMRLFLFM